MKGLSVAVTVLALAAQAAAQIPPGTQINRTTFPGGMAITATQPGTPTAPQGPNLPVSLSLEKSVSTHTPAVGELFQYVLSISNAGPGPANAVVAFDTDIGDAVAAGTLFPVDLNFVSFPSGPPGNFATAEFTFGPSGGTFGLYIDKLPPNGTVAVALTVELTGPGIVRNQATLQTGCDPLPDPPLLTNPCTTPVLLLSDDPGTGAADDATVITTGGAVPVAGPEGVAALVVVLLSVGAFGMWRRRGR